MMPYIAILIVGGIFGFLITSSLYEKTTINHNCAHYDSKTGNFVWNTEGQK